MATTPSPPIMLLNADVLREFFLHLSKYELLDATLVCWEWHHVAQKLVDRTLELVVSESMQTANLQLLRRVRLDEALQHRVQHVHVKEWHLDDLPMISEIEGYSEHPWMPGNYFSMTYVDQGQSSPESKEILPEICYALATANAKSFMWSALRPMPALLFKQLSFCPACEVHIRRNERAYDAAVWTYLPIFNHPQLHNLFQISQQLVTLDLLLPPNDEDLMASLGELVASALKLRTLKLHSLGKLWGGHHIPLFRRTVRGCVFAPARSMDWLSIPTSASGRMLALEELELDHFCVCGDTTFRLDSITDPSRLKKVGLSCFSFLEPETKIFDLRSFRLHCHNPRGYEDEYCRGSWSVAGVREMLFECKGLETLELVDGPEILNKPLLESLGEHLISLSLHQVIRVDPCAKYDLDIISQTCLRLQKLSVDFSWEEPILSFSSDLVSRFPQLAVLSIRRGEEEQLLVDHFTPDPHRFSTTISDVRTIWDNLATDSSRLVKLILQDSFLKPWDRDVHFFYTCAPYASNNSIAPKAYEARVRLPKRMIKGPQDVKVRCLDVEEARRALKHGWKWLDGQYQGQDNWSTRLRQIEKTAIEGRYLVLRMTPNAEGGFTQQPMH